MPCLVGDLYFEEDGVLLGVELAGDGHVSPCRQLCLLRIPIIGRRNIRRRRWFSCFITAGKRSSR
uniref:Uncharacterized protein n=1 Tax=Arundo donax TaxID=35708 RepID=A0A0A9DSW4_ARUDO